MIGFSGGGLTRRVMMGGTIGAGLVAAIFSESANAAPARASEVAPPRVHTRTEWGARSSKRRAQLLAAAPDRIVIHHTATPNSTDYSLGHAYRLSRMIQRFHMRHRGWDDIGEQLTISRGGHIMEGRNGSLAAIMAGRHVVGAQTRHHNRHTIGIENEGTYTRAHIPPALWSSLVATCTWLCAIYRLDPYRAIVGHRDYGDTTCPGNMLYARLPELRGTVAARLPRTAGGRSRQPRQRRAQPPSPEPPDSQPPGDQPPGDQPPAGRPGRPQRGGSRPQGPAGAAEGGQPTTGPTEFSTSAPPLKLPAKPDRRPGR